MTLIPFNDGWTVARGDGPAQPVTLPHDAMIGEPRDAANPSASHGAYFPGGRYTYTKRWTPEAVDHAWLIFEGVMGEATVTLNGTELARWDSGYREAQIPLEGLQPGEENTLVVTADTTAQPNSRWYAGSGLYRPVWLRTAGAAWFARDGVQITTRSATAELARVAVAIHAGGDLAGARVAVRLLDGGTEVAGGTADIVKNQAFLDLAVPDPKLWSGETPNLYTAEATLTAGGQTVDAYTARVGLRTITADARRGLRVNGEPVVLRGTCLHHDNGILGAATLAGAEYRRVKILKENGFNAIRSSHNPAARSLLDACDELGVFVMDELTDMWEQRKTAHDHAARFAEDWEEDIAAMVAKDRNHASVIFYSTGNEIPDIAGARGAEVAWQLADRFRALDPTRLTSLAVNHLVALIASTGRSLFDGANTARPDQDKPATAASSTAANLVTSLLPTAMGLLPLIPAADKVTRDAAASVDVVGYNYAWRRYAKDAKLYPARVMCGTESFPGDIVNFWGEVERRPYVIGDFMWIGWDYLGETGIGVYSYNPSGAAFSTPYPGLLAGSGAIDITGLPGAPMLLARAVWDLLEGPAIAVRPLDHAGQKSAHTPWRTTDAIPSWSWRGQQGTLAQVEVYSHADAVELFCNGVSLGRKPAGPAHKFQADYKLPYAPGELTAVEYRGGRETGRTTLRSSSGPLTLKLTADTPPPGDVVYVAVDVVDGSGTPEMLADDDLVLTVEGGEPAGFGSARPVSADGFTSGQARTYYGHALAAIRPTGGPLKVTVTGQGLGQAVLEL